MRGFFGTTYSARILLAALFLFASSGYIFAQTKIMPLGNSITRGVDGPSTDDAGYRNDLSALLQAEEVTFDFVGSLSDGTGFDPNHEGHDGFRADQLFANINTYLGANPNIIILHIGTNDVSNDQTPESTRNEISDIIDAIHSFSPSIKIILSSIAPRTDGKDPQTLSLNTLIEDLFYTKRDEGRNLYYAGVYEIFKQNASWATDYFESSDNVHPNDTGFNVMGEVYFNAVMTALNSSNTNITDNFERTNLGITWSADAEFALQSGVLANTATTGTGNWEYMATFRGVKNPTSAAVKWAASVDANGLKEGGLALLLDAPSKNADGYLAWITTDDNNIRLWTIVSGHTDNDLNLEQVSQASTPGPGDVFRVDLTVDGSNLQFDYYVNDVFAGNITTPNPGGLGSELYSGIILKHNLNNNVDEFIVRKTSDTAPPDPVTNLSVGSPTATSIPLTWTATGDDGSTGQASSYDLRYSTQLIDNTNFDSATQVAGVSGPAPAGSIENVTVSGLQAGTQYFVAVKVVDEAGNSSTLSNVVTSTTIAGNFFSDDFNRTNLDNQWTADPDYAIVDNRLSNTSSSGAWNEMAILNARKNPNEISFRWGDNVDASGIDQAGFALVFGSASATGNGYAVTRRTGSNNEIRLWELVNGEITNLVDKNQSPNLSPPNAGDLVKIVISSSGASNKFEYFTNDQFDGSVEDTGFLYDMTQDNWGGVTLRGGNNNDIDDFTILLEVGSAAGMVALSGNVQADTVGQQLPAPLIVRVTDDAGSPVSGFNVNFSVLSGGGSVDVAPAKTEIVIEAEQGTLTSPMVSGSDGNASGSGFIEVPDGTGGQGQGQADYTVQITDAGNYIMWGRAIFANANADAFAVIVDGTTYNWDVGQRSHRSSWTWDEVTHRGSGSATSPELDPVVMTLSAGQHTLSIKESKDGTKLDQFVLVKQSASFQPPADESAIVPGGTFTNSSGEALTRLTLGPNPGINQVRAFGNGVPDVLFTATGTAGNVASITKLSGDAQTGTAGQVLSLPFVVEVFDAFGNPAEGATTTWTILGGANGSLSAGSDVVVNASGQASNTLTLATNMGLNQVQVTTLGYTGPDVIFTATPNPGAAASIVLVSGNGQEGTGSMPLGLPFKVQVVDAIGTPVPNHAVGFKVIAGGGNFNGSNEVTATTGTDGIAAATMTLGPSPGSTNQAQAIVDGLSGSPVTFSASAANPQSLEAVSGLLQSGTASVPLIDSIKVLVKDIRGNPLPNYPVEFSVTLGGGSVNESSSPITVSTDMQGVAKVAWRLGPNAGSGNNKIVAKATFNNNDLAGSPIEFTASAAVGDAANLLEVSGNSQSGLVESVLDQPFVARVTDASNNPVVGWPVTFSVQEGGGSFSGQATVVASTDNEGNAKATLKLGSSAGSPANPFNNKVQVSAQNNSQHLNGSPLAFQASAISTGARDLVLVGGNNQSGLAGEVLSQQIQVKVTDGPNSNPIPNHEVTFKVSQGGGTLNGTTLTQIQVLTDGSGIAAASWALGGSLGASSQSLEVRANDGINDLTNSPLTIHASASAGRVDPDASTVVSDVSAVQADGSSMANIEVTLTDKFGNPIPGKAVKITSSGSNNAINSPDNPTDAAGKAAGSISSIKAETKTISARNITDGITLNSFVNVTFLSEPPKRVSLSNGNGQSANVGTAVPQSVEVLVSDDFNNPVPGVKVEFEVISGGGFIAQTSAAGSGSPQSLSAEETTTDSNGKASATWVLGSTPGTNEIRAKAFFNGAQLSGSPVTFTAQGLISTATTMSLHSGNNQTGPAGLALSQPLAVQVTDAAGRPVSGVKIDFNVTLGGGSLSKEAPITNYEGIARTEITLGRQVGTNAVDAVNSQLSGTPIPFTLEGMVGLPAKFVRYSGHGESATVNTLHEIGVQVTDYFDNPRDGVDVAFEVVEGSASVSSHDAITSSGGIANAQILMSNTIEDVVVKVTSEELPGFFATFEIHSVAGTAGAFAFYSGNNQEGTVGRALVKPLVVKVTDQFGNSVSGQEVQWVRTVGGGSISQTTTFSNDEGLAWTEFTLGQLGENKALAIASQLTPGQLTFTATGVSNNFPEFSTLDDKEITEGNLLQFQINASDADSDPLTYQADNLPSGATFNAGSATFSWTPNQAQHGEYKVTFTVADNRGGLDMETIKITVVNSNNFPEIVSFTPNQLTGLFFTKGEVIPFSVSATDADAGDIISYSWRIFAGNIPQGGQLLSTSPGFDFVTDNFEPATYSIRVEVTDGHDTESLTWNLDLLVVSVELASFSGKFDGFNGVGINWVTARENNNTGFNILRARSKDGEFARINAEIISVSQDGEYTYSDKKVDAGTRYFYKLEDIALNGVKTQHGPIEVFIAAPERFELSQNYPNPFNPTTNIRFQLPKAGHVKVRIFDILGREVRTLVEADFAADFHVVTWNARDNQGVAVGSGVYYYQVVTAAHRETKKMLLIK